MADGDKHHPKSGNVSAFLAKVCLGGVVLGVVSHFLFAHLNLMEHWHHVAGRYEDYELEEIPFIFAVISVYLIVFLWWALSHQRKLRRDLEQEVRVREDAQIRLSEALTARERFFSAMSHDLRTPVNSISGLAYLMRTGTFGPMANERYQGYVEDIHRAATMLDMTIAQVLDVTTLSGDHLLHIADDMIDPDEEVRFASGLVSGWTGAAQAIDIRASGPVPHLLFDQTLFRRMIANLLTNSAKYAGTDATVTVTFAEDSGGGLRIAVQDDGPGVDSALLADFREPYKRGPGNSNGKMAKGNMAKGNMDGVGLGLWIVEQIAKAHGAEIEFDSAPGQGFCVTVCVPAFRVLEKNELLKAAGSGI